MALAALTLNTSSGSTVELLLRRGTTDEALAKNLFEQQEYSLERLRRGSELAALARGMGERGEHPLILDLGANVGFAAAYFALAFPEAVIVSVEPEPDNFALLEQNAARLAPARVWPLRAAAASRPGELAVHAQAESWAHTTSWADGTPGPGRVRAVTVGELLGLDFAGRFGASTRVAPFIAKVDIEGFEADLFEGETGWIDQFPVLIIELHDWLFPKKATSRSFLSAIAGKDRDFVILGENVFSIRNGERPPPS